MSTAANFLSRILAALAMALVLAGGAQAVPITIFNTGVDGSGTPLADGTIGDPHYTLISVPSGTTDIRVRREVGGFPATVYVPDNTLSAWIGPNNTVELDGDVGSYVYRTTFNLTGLESSTAQLSGQWATDNSGIDILINGVSTFQVSPFFDSFTAFSITSGFVAGINTLDFVVFNAGGPTALRVEVDGTAVPEPGTLALLGLALAGLGARKRRS